VGDALHLALASVYKCDYLLTSNFANLAIADKIGHICHHNVMHNLFVPMLVTPFESVVVDNYLINQVRRAQTSHCFFGTDSVAT
jgi:hypothetical protein